MATIASPASSKRAQDVPGRPLLDGVGLDDGQGALDGHGVSCGAPRRAREGFDGGGT